MSESWHLDKRVPLALMFALAVQTGGALWWAASISAEVASVVKDTTENKLDIKAGNSTEPRLVRVETDISYIRRAVDDNKSKLDKLDTTLTELLREARTSPR